MDFIFLKNTFTDICKRFLQVFTPGGMFAGIAAGVMLMFQHTINLFLVAYFFVFVDMLTGILASLMKGNGFRSRRFYVSIAAKTFIHSMMIFLTYGFATLFNDIIPFTPYVFTGITAGFICFYEFTSIVENVLSIFPDMVYLNKLKALFDRLVNKKVQVIEGAIDQIPIPKDESQKPDQSMPEQEEPK